MRFRSTYAAARRSAVGERHIFPVQTNSKCSANSLRIAASAHHGQDYNLPGLRDLLIFFTTTFWNPSYSAAITEPTPAMQLKRHLS